MSMTDVAKSEHGFTAMIALQKYLYPQSEGQTKTITALDITNVGCLDCSSKDVRVTYVDAEQPIEKFTAEVECFDCGNCMDLLVTGNKGILKYPGLKLNRGYV